jgi:hypothetical protein
MVRHVSSTAWKPNPPNHVRAKPIGRWSCDWRDGFSLTGIKKAFSTCGLYTLYRFSLVFISFLIHCYPLCFDFLRPFSCIEEGKACGCTTAARLCPCIRKAMRSLVSCRPHIRFENHFPALLESRRTSPVTTSFRQWPCFEGNFVNLSPTLFLSSEFPFSLNYKRKKKKWLI